MNGHKHLADTNTLIFLLNKHPSLKPLVNSDWYYSFITEIELFGKAGITSKEIKDVRNPLAVRHKIPHTESINQTTISLKQKFKIKTPDAIIAATSIQVDMPLLTFDKGFTQIDMLDIILLEI